MDQRWRWNRFKLRAALIIAFWFFVFDQNSCFCSSENTEGFALLKFKEGVRKDPYGALLKWDFNDGGYLDHCSWFGVECSAGKVVSLSLGNLRLEGALAPELGQLTHLKSIILRNNSFSGIIPEEIGQLKNLEVLDLGYNNFTGPFPSNFSNNLSLSILLLDNNKHISYIPSEIYNLAVVSESLMDRSQPGLTYYSQINYQIMELTGEKPNRKLQQVTSSSGAISSGSSSPDKKSKSPSSPLLSTSPSPSPSPSPMLSPNSFPPSTSISISMPPSLSFSSPSISPEPSPAVVSTRSPHLLPRPTSAPPSIPPVVFKPRKSPSISLPYPASPPTQTVKTNNKPKRHVVFILSGVAACSLVVFTAAIGFVYCRRSKVVTVKPWATGLSGQLQKAFVAGVPKLLRSELETACEDFSNIIGSLSDGTVYKGTLSSGVEIAVTSTAVKASQEWSKKLEDEFRNKIDTLSKINHKNFVNLIGYCEEDEPFTRMMVFEYAPNGTLFEHLHIKESEHLDWVMRLRVVMGMAFCLEYMHQLNPPLSHRNLQSTCVYLTEDYAAKISDFSFWNEVMAAKMGSSTMELLETSFVDLESDVYNFGVILFEIITGRLPYSVGGSLVDWALNYLRQGQPLKKMVDPTLKSFREDQLEKMLEVAKDCVRPDPYQRPTMGEVTARLKQITEMGSDGATPKSSPLWWAELEIMSTESS